MDKILESEKAVIGSIILEPACIDLVAQCIASGAYFRNSQCGNIYDVILSMHRERKNIDLVTVADQIDPRQVEFLAVLAHSVPTSAHAEEYAKTVRDNHARRVLAGKLKTYNPLDATKYPTPLDALTALEKEIREAGQLVDTADETDLEELVMGRYDAYYIEEAEGNRRITPTGFIDLDEIITGVEKGENIVLGARPSMGKTALALNIMLNLAKQGKKVIFFSLEMNKERLVDRLLCINGKLDAEKFKRRKLTSNEKKILSESVGEIQALPIVIVDKQRSILAIKSILAKHAQRGPVALAVIDFLQLVVDRLGGNRSRSNEVGAIAKNIQLMAQEYDVPIMTLSQLNRKVEGREDKRPNLGDLYESGDIEAAADKVIFLYRDQNSPHIAEIGVAKQRDGKTGSVKLTWLPPCTRFENYSERS